MKLIILCLCITSSLCGKNYHENILWGQPCLNDTSIASTSKSAEEIVRYSNWIHEQLDSYKDEFIQKMEKLEGFTEFVDTTDWGKTEWLRGFYWYTEEMLPKEKVLGRPLPAEYFHNLRAKTHDGDDVMTKIHAALKFLEGSLYKLFQNKTNKELLEKDVDFGHSVRESIRIIRSIICSMDNYMKNRELQIMVLLDDFLPEKPDYAGKMLRDIFNYFEYIKQLFESLSQTK